MNRACPTCGDDLLERGEPELQEWRDGWLEVVQETPDPVPYSEKMRPERYGPDGDLDGLPPIGGLWFCSEDCRDEYQEQEDEADG